MKEAFWGVLIIILGIFGIVCINLFQNVTVDNDKVYYVLKESTEASAHDSIDLSYYRLGGTLRIVEDKFVENLARRFSQSITAGNYTISVQNINELPPLMSVKVRSGVTSIKGDEFNLTNRVDAIIETKYKLSEVLDFLGITEEEWNDINNKNKDTIKDGVCGVTFINDNDLECITGDLKFDGLSDTDLKNSVCIGQQKSNVDVTAKYSVCECGKWTQKEETLVANPVYVVNNGIGEYVYTYTLKKTGEIRNIDETITKRVRADICTTAVEVYVPKDLREKEPSSDNSKYVKCDPVSGIRIPEGVEVVLHPNYIPSNATNREIKWTPGNASLLSFSSFSVTQPRTVTGFSKAVIKGKLSGTEEEKTTMTATTTLNQSAVCPIRVWDGNVDSVTCNDDTIYVGSGDVTIKGKYEPYNATKLDFKYSTENTDILTITEKGIINAVKEGTATIKVTAPNGKTGACTITVKKPSSEYHIYYSGDYGDAPGTIRYKTAGDAYYAMKNNSKDYTVKESGGYYVVVNVKTGETIPPVKTYQTAAEAAKDSNGLGAVQLEDGSWAVANNVNSQGKTIYQLTGNPDVRNAGAKLDDKCGDSGCSSADYKKMLTNKHAEERKKQEQAALAKGDYNTYNHGTQYGTAYSDDQKYYNDYTNKHGSNMSSKSNTPTTSTPITTPSRGKGCLAKGTKVTLANGLTKNIEDVNYNDLLLVWNYETGSYTYEYPIWIEKENYSDNYIKISFEDGTHLNVVENHALYSADINEFVTVDKLEIGTTIAKIVNNKIEYTKVKSIEVVNEGISYYHVVSTRYYNIVANGVLTTDDAVILSNLYGFNSDISWKNRNYKSLSLYTYSEFSDILPYYMYKGLRVDEAKVIENAISKTEFRYYLLDNPLNEDLLNNPKTDLFGNRTWMVTTSEDYVTMFNKNKYLYKEGSTYIIPKSSKVLYWYNTADGKEYKSGDKITVNTGMHLIAEYK